MVNLTNNQKYLIFGHIHPFMFVVVVIFIIFSVKFTMLMFVVVNFSGHVHRFRSYWFGQVNNPHFNGSNHRFEPTCTFLKLWLMVNVTILRWHTFLSLKARHHKRRDVIYDRPMIRTCGKSSGLFWRFQFLQLPGLVGFQPLAFKD